MEGMPDELRALLGDTDLLANTTISTESHAAISDVESYLSVSPTQNEATMKEAEAPVAKRGLH
ncbi:hypothetical protein GN958_ATG16349 [Phytophthora infestans]|uniref:Uncharacterized protein n=1 Tax=Phytophthora infestans TaxID=4787 RepID=A0A8S9U8A4_PHYIN|nr:hypothetical protein GN958_ATG16349 [Phytophthora infestans]